MSYNMRRGQGSNASRKTRTKPIPGTDSKGRCYVSAEALWKGELRGDLYDPKKGWYGKSLEYWKNTPATIDGVLGGISSIHDMDIKESADFISALPDHGTKRAIDCGAGIGRIAKHLLCNIYEITDLLEPVEHMIIQAMKELDGLPMGDFILSSMEKVSLPPQTYDLIVIQWCSIYLTDDDFVKFFRNAKQALTPQGYIFFKENCINGTTFVVDREDSSLTRSDLHYKQLFKKAGVRVVMESLQQEWPQDLFPVMMYGLQ
ncbi:unnamed protein product [Phytomonas sp. Hart1]|nr:unnamed protein product [Phytomonas sp. Hart1]|eukprot:CCW67997.1 unnamed protein product [Phytomonas sp. isolate Hart1]